jgi:alkanesulfonate monooxygenase SsuD/methylene tetrahydromethanopterin reductase-like flavin-dependent oxidoreductase (luciferase family)
MPAAAARPPVPPEKLRLGLILPTWTTTDLRWSEVLEVASTAAQVGFDALYVTDHLLLPGNNAELKRRAGVDFPDDPDVELEGYMECFTLLSALAVEIPRLTLGTLVACTGYRNTGLLAKIAVTIDDISGGRLVLGLGAGDSLGEHNTFGFLYEQPVTRFEEALKVLKGLFHEDPLDFDGAHHRLRGARLLPRGPRPAGPPILIGTLNPGPRMRRLVDHRRRLP